MDLIISPEYSRDKTLFSILGGRGIVKTLDGGKTWVEANNGITNPVNIVISPDYGSDRTLFAGTENGIFKTTDGARSWQRLESRAFEGFEAVDGIALSPYYKSDGTVIVSMHGKGLFRTEDGGASFVEIGRDLIEKNHQLRYFRFSPSYRSDHTIYAISTEELFVSTDRGTTWRMIPRPLRYEDQKPHVVRYEGTWDAVTSKKFSASSVTRSRTPGSKAHLTFVGSGVSWLGETSPEHGSAHVFIDGVFKQAVSLYSETHEILAKLFVIDGLPEGPHEITVAVSPEAGKQAGGYVSIDAFDVSR